MGNIRKILYAAIVMLPTIAWGQTLYTPQGTEIPNPIGNNGYKQGYFYRFEEYTSAQKAPIITDIDIYQYGQSENEYTLRVVTNQPYATYYWSVTEGTIHDLPRRCIVY